MKRKSLLFEIIQNSSLKEKSFSVKDINKFCDNLLLKSPSFISKHCEGNPGGYSEYFKRVSKGNYTIIKKWKYIINILSIDDYNEVKNQIIELLKDKNSNFSILIMRRETPSPENTIIEIDVEFPLIGHLLNNLVKEYNNINYEDNNFENYNIMNKVIIIKT